MNLNKEWHSKHIMPKNATLEERVAWHLEHQRNCQCRDMPESIKLAIKHGKGMPPENR